MRRTIAILLSVLMLLSIACVGISAAPEGTAVGTVAEFAGMKADGTYYLSADIKLTESYAEAFTGKLDGNGHTVTITAPIFKEFNGTVSNLTIDGTELQAADDLAALAVYTKGMTAINCVNKVDITVTGISADLAKGLNAGGFVADALGDIDSVCIFRKCVNEGNITIQTVDVKDAASGAMYEVHAGGLAGRADGFNAKYCENKGNITALSNRGQTGGMVGRAAFSALLTPCNIEDCTNTGAVTSGYDAGGMVAYTGASNNNIYEPYTVKYCLNTGDITGGYRVGGFVGYAYASGKNLTYYLEVTYSVQLGNIIAGRAAADLAGKAQVTFGSLFVGYSNSMWNTIAYCIGSGTLTKLAGDNINEPYFCIMGCSSATTMEMPLENNYMNDGNGTVWYSYATSDDNAAQRIDVSEAITAGKVTRCTADELKNGTILSKLNAAAKEDYLSQAVGTDAAPTINLTLRDKRASEDTLEDKTEDTTEAPAVTTEKPKETAAPDKETTPAPKDTDPASPDVTNAPGAEVTKAPDTEPAKEKGGCGSAFACGIAAVAVLGFAVVLGKKKH